MGRLGKALFRLRLHKALPNLKNKVILKSEQKKYQLHTFRDITPLAAIVEVPIKTKRHG